MANALVLMGLILFAISDEIHQSFVPGRTASYVDVALNIVGILFGFYAFKILRVPSSSKENDGPLILDADERR